MPEPLTPRQKAAYQAIVEALKGSGVFPSLHELKDRLGIASLSSVSEHLDALERKGWLVRCGAKGSARSWRVTEDVGLAESMSVPVIGTIAAGVPITAVEQVEEHVAVPTALVNSQSECFILRVRGDSMIGDSICDGDWAIVQSQSTARSGDIVAVVIEDEATLKHYVKIGPRIELHASNPTYDPIPIVSDNCRIVGKLVGLMRRIH